MRPHRAPANRVRILAAAAATALASISMAEDRSYDGTGNNLANPTLGSAFTAYRREASGAHYADGISSPNGAAWPSARAISNTMMNQGEASALDPRGLTAMVYTWGQFVDHDLDLRTNASPPTSLNIIVPTGDPQFDPSATGTQVIPMTRSALLAGTGTSTLNPGQQINTVTSYLDTSQVYGSDALRAAWLRTGSGGRLKSTSAPTGSLLPYNDGTQTMDGIFGPSTSTSLFVAGDSRANEQIGITAIQTLAMREHNRQATLLARANPGWSDELIYQKARKIVDAEMTAITYNEFLPAMLGNSAMPAYSGYSAGVDPSASNAFATVGFRVGHSMLDDDIERVGPDGNTLAKGNLPLRSAFFNPSAIPANGGVDPILRGFTTRVEQAVDLKMVDDIRSFLFGPPGAGGMDLAAIDIQRARDHGLADYNTMRQDFGLPKVTTFAQITADAAVQQQLQALYGDVNHIDSFVGALAEDPLAGSSVGPLASAIMVDQFNRSRAGDRLFYMNDPAFTPAEIAAINGFKFSDLIRRNTFVRNIQDNAFVAGAINVGATWNLPGSGPWNSVASWANPAAIPGGAGVNVDFLTNPSGPATISLNTPVTIGSIVLSNTNSVTIAPGSAGTLAFDNLGSSAAILASAGAHTISAPVTLADDLTILYSGNAGLTITSPIGESNPGRTLTIDGSQSGLTGGGVTTLSAGNSFTGGLSATHSLVNLNHASAQGPLGALASASDNGELVINFTPTAQHALAAGDLGAIQGSSSTMAALAVGTNLSLSPGAMIVRQSAGSSLPANLGTTPLYYNAFTVGISGASASITVGATSGTPWKGIGSGRSASYTWGLPADTLTLAGNTDVVALGASTLNIAAKVVGGLSSDTLTKRGTGTGKLANAANSFAAGNIVVESGTLALAPGSSYTLASATTATIKPDAMLAFNDGFNAVVSGTVLNNGSILKPAGMTSRLSFTGAALTGSGVILAQDSQPANSGPPNFTSFSTSSIFAHGVLFDNAKTNYLGGMGSFDSDNSAPILSINGASTVVHLTGRWDGDGANVFSWLQLTNGGRFMADAGAAMDTKGDAPDGQLQRSFSVRGDGTGTLDFADGFVANQRDDIPGKIEFYTLSLGNATWITHSDTNMPDSNIEIHDEDGAFWSVRTHDQSLACGLTTSKNYTIDTQTNLTLSPDKSWLHINATKTVTKSGPGTLTVPGENAITNANGISRTFSGAVGMTLKVIGGKFVTMTDMGQAATLAGANGVFGPAGLPDSDDVVTTSYAWNLNLNNAGTVADFNASQHLLSLKINSGSRANLKPFTYGNNSATALSAKTLGVDTGTGTLDVAALCSATVISGSGTAFALAPSTTLIKSSAGSMTINANASYGTSSTLSVTGGSLNLASGAAPTVGTGVVLSIAAGASVTAGTSFDPFTDATLNTRHMSILSDGALSVTAGTKSVDSIDPLTGSGGVVTVSTLTTLSATRIRQTTLNLVGTAAVTIRPNGAPAFASVLKNLSLAGAASNPTAKLDLADNDLILDYTGSATTLYANTLAQLKAGRNGVDASSIANWNGKGITSSTIRSANLAKGFDLFAIALINNADLANSAIGRTPYTSFDGVNTDASTLLLKYTYSGDADANGFVDGDDYALIDNAFNNLIPKLGWLSGDFNYDGLVDGDDYGLIDSGYLFQGPPLAGASAWPASAVSAVPEPAVVSMLAMALPGLLRRRR